ncbi:MAG: transglycosylase domain-containing protein [Acetobacteraceae bacterium]
MLRRGAKVVAALVIVAGFAVALLFFCTPSVGAAPTLVQAAAREHGIAYPGPNPPRRFIEALVATEDHRFYSSFDPGIDPIAIGRVILAKITRQRDQGGSTIEQQLAKMLYTPVRAGRVAKLEQLALAVKLDLAYSKARILSMYAETAYYGDGYYGLVAASCGYFGRKPADLTWAQAATLAGVLNAPTADDPRRHPVRARARESHVFARLVAVKYLSKTEAKAALSQPLGLVPLRGPRRRSPCSGDRRSS